MRSAAEDILAVHEALSPFPAAFPLEVPQEGETWFVDAPEVDAASEDPAYDAWVNDMESRGGAERDDGASASQPRALFLL